jgi:hypothetical protein
MPRWYHRLLAWVLSPFRIMVKECAWCRKFTGFKLHGTGVTSGMCMKCYEREERKLVL